MGNEVLAHLVLGFGGSKLSSGPRVTILTVKLNQFWIDLIYSR